MAQLCLHCLKKAGSRTRHPLPRLSRWRSGWNVPRSREPAEVIQANHIDVSQQSTQPIDAPPITSRTHCIPVVNGIAPQLTLRAEIIGRNPATNCGRFCSSSRNSSGFAQTSLESVETKKGRSPIKL